jgi:hypothetical protein
MSSWEGLADIPLRFHRLTFPSSDVSIISGRASAATAAACCACASPTRPSCRRSSCRCADDSMCGWPASGHGLCARAQPASSPRVPIAKWPAPRAWSCLMRGGGGVTAVACAGGKGGEAVRARDGLARHPGPLLALHGESKRLVVVESPWSQFTSECQRFGHPPRLDNSPF